MSRVLLVLPNTTYRAPEFLAASAALGVEVVTASDVEQAFASQMADRFLVVDLDDPDQAAADLVTFAERVPLDALIAVDDRGLMAAAIAAAALGLSANPVDAVAATRNKVLMRDRLATQGVGQPAYAVVSLDDLSFVEDAVGHAEKIGYPVVLKPSSLAGSRGVIRADNAAEARAAAARIAALCADSEDSPTELFVESFIVGTEVALEGLLKDGELEVLALFDKPDPLDGPYFEETLYVTPSSLDAALQRDVATAIGRACQALGLREGPVHAEARITPDRQVLIIEAAARTIGGKCSKALSFASHVTLEEIVLRHALGLPHGDVSLSQASGVMMLPIRASGRLIGVHGRDRTLATPGITSLEISIPIGHHVRALPEGDRYLGFLFARGETPAEVEQSLRDGYSALDIEVQADMSERT